MRARRTAPVSWEGQHLVAAGLVECVEERGAAARTELANALIEEIDVVGEVLGEIGLDVETLDEGAIVDVEDLQEKLDGGVLLELKALADGARGVEHDADAEGKIGLLLEAKHGDRRTAIIEKPEVFALEASDELTLLVGDGEDEIHFVDTDNDVGSAGGRYVGLLGRRLGRALGCRQSWCLGLGGRWSLTCSLGRHRRWLRGLGRSAKQARRFVPWARRWLLLRCLFAHGEARRQLQGRGGKRSR